MYRVIYRTRGMNTGWFEQSVIRAASSAEAARDLVGDMLARQYKAGSWFVDWAVLSAEKVG